MRHHARSILSSCLAATLALPAHAAPTFQTMPYLKTCEGFLTAVEGNRIESFLMDQARTPAERTQLLLDYGLVFTAEYGEAIRAVLRRGPLGSGRRGQALRMRALRAVPRALRSFAAEVLTEFERRLDETAAIPEGRARRDRVRRFVAAVNARSDRAAWLDAAAAAMRASLALALRDHRQWAIDKARDHAPVHLVGVPMLAVSFAEYQGLATPMSGIPMWLQMLPFGLLGISCGLIGSLGTMAVEAAWVHFAPVPADPSAIIARGHPVSFERSITDRGTPVGEVPTLASIRPHDLGNLTPVDLAYAGEVELANFEALLGANAAFDARALDHDLARLEERAQQLAADWADPRARLRFAATINDLIEIFTELRGTLRGRLSAGRGLLRTLREQIDRVGRVPLTATSSQLNDESVLKQELLMLRHRYAAERLAKVRIEDRATEDLVERIEPLITELGAVLSPAPSTIEDWRKVVERARVVAARITAALAGVPRLDAGGIE